MVHRAQSAGLHHRLPLRLTGRRPGKCLRWRAGEEPGAATAAGAGNHSRDFTFIDDIVEGVIRANDHIAAANPDWDSDSPDPASSNAPFRLFNIGNANSVKLADYIAAIEKALGRTAIKEMLPLQPGDAPDTFADVSELEARVGYRPATPVEEGVAAFVEWYKAYYS